MKLFLLLLSFLIFISCNNDGGKGGNVNSSKKTEVEYTSQGETNCRDIIIEKDRTNYQCNNEEFNFKSANKIIISKFSDNKKILDYYTKQTFTAGIMGEFSFSENIENIEFTARQMTEKLVNAIKKITTQRSKDVFKEKLPEINTTPIEAFKDIDFDKLISIDFNKQ